MKKTAILLGASGLTGGLVLQKLIEDERYGHILLFSRSKIENLPSKVTQFIGDLLKLEQFKSQFVADEVYCCIGTTTKKTPDKTLYKQIDFGIPVTAAKLSKENNIPTFVVISAMGANQNSNVFYNKTKGEMEDAVLKQHIKNTFILRPSLIEGKRNANRTLENLGLVLLKVIQPLFIGKFKDYKIIKAETIAEAMIQLANHKNSMNVIVKSDAIKKITNNN